MSITIELSHNSTGVTAKSASVPVFSYGDIYSRSTKCSANEVILINKLSPIDRPEEVRIATKKIADVYKDSGVSTDLQNATKSGSQTVAGVKGTYKKTDSVSGKVTYGPYKVHIVAQFPDDPDLTDSHRYEIVQRVIGLLSRSTGASATDVSSNLTAMAMGGIIPAGV